MARMQRTRTLSLCCSIVATCFAGAAAAHTYKCLDSEGYTRYVDDPTAGSECAVVAVAGDEVDPGGALEPAEVSSSRRPNLPIGFRGDSILDLLAAIEQSEKGGVVASNFAEANAPALGPRIFRFVVPPELNPGVAGDQREVAALDYDAEAKVMTASLWSGRQMFRVSQASPPYNTVLLARSWKESVYTGQNMLGATTQVTAVRTDEYGLALANVTMPRPTALVSSAIPMRTESARDAAGDLAFYLDVRLKPANGSRTGVLRDAVRQRATMSDPFDSVITQRFLLAEVVEAGIFRRSTGEILTWKSFRAAHEACADGSCGENAPLRGSGRRFN